jgi:hypothetical protein
MWRLVQTSRQRWILAALGTTMPVWLMATIAGAIIGGHRSIIGGCIQWSFLGFVLFIQLYSFLFRPPSRVRVKIHVTD